MGIIGMIAKTKKGFHDTRLKIISGQTARIQEANLKEAEITKAKQEYREARQIRADLRADQMKPIEGEQPSIIKKMGQGMASHMNKTKKPMIGVPTSTQNQPSGIFGGQRNLNVGGETDSPFKHKKGKDLF